MEVAKRVAILVLALFAYIALGLLALVGLACRCSCSTSQNPISTAPFYDKIKQAILRAPHRAFGDEISQAVAMNKIQSIKLIIDITCDETPHNQAQVLSTVGPLLTSDDLDRTIDTMLSGPAASHPECRSSSDCKWAALIKTREGEGGFYTAWGHVIHSRGEYANRASTRHPPSEHAMSYFYSVLDDMGRPNDTIQFDAQGNFV